MNKRKVADTKRAIENIQNKVTRDADRIIVGQYTGKKEPIRTEGEVWTDINGKEWTVRNGIKQSISPLQDAKTPWWCPTCNRTMNHLDVKVFRSTGECYDCLSKKESRIKMDGDWAKYVEKRELQNRIAYLKERIVEITYYHDTLTVPEIQHFDDKTGVLLMVDRYNIPIDKVKADMRTTVVDLNKTLKELENEYTEKYEDS